MSKLNMHPDKGGDTERAKLINEAYECLSDENKRAEYDVKYYKHFTKSKIDPAEAGNENENIESEDDTWSTKPLSDSEIDELARYRLSKLIRFDVFKDELKQFIKKNKG